MTSKTESALQALVAALLATSASMGSALPGPLRNEALPARMFDAGDKLSTHLNVWDGSAQPTEELLGTDQGEADCYEIAHEAIIEWIVAGGSAADREAKFDLGLENIHDAIKPDLTGGDTVYLGGAVQGARITSIARQGSGLVIDGMPNARGAEITIELLFTSSRPF
jgi:hypothetical protein